MKITRLKKGYRITLNDSDFRLLAGMVESADDQIVDAFDMAHWEPAVKKAYTHRTKGGRLMRVDEDRR